MDVKDAIALRRSIRRYKTDDVPREALLDVMEAAHLAPSGTNHQPWRFVIVKDPSVKAQIREVGHDQKFLTQAPVIIVCCADISVYEKNTRKRVEELAAVGALNPDKVNEYPGYSAPMDGVALKKHQGMALFNVALAMENIALRAVSLGLGTCVVQHMSARKVAEILNLPQNLVVGALMTLGYPDEDPKPRPRVPLADIIVKEV
jgi:nitroreductase